MLRWAARKRSLRRVTGGWRCIPRQGADKVARNSRSKGLTLRQRARVSAIQSRRAANLDVRRQEHVQALSTGGLGAEERGRVIAHFGLNVEVEDERGERFRCAVRKTAPEEPVCGDRVIWQRAVGAQGVITGVLERRTVLRRPTACQGLQTVAANVERIMVVLAAEGVNTGLLDRYLVAAEAAGIEAGIVVNKIDRLSDPAGVMADLAHYGRMGYPVYPVSATRGTGLPALEEALSGQVSVFVGQSGVGKSALIGHWVTGNLPKVGEIHLASGQGRHTTTAARFYHLPGGGGLIDSPGVREFGLHGVTRAMVARHYRDISPHLETCRFSNCSHRHEPDCAVREAVSQGDVHPDRLASLFRILDSLPAENSF